MPHSQEKTPEQTTELPNPDLNPLLNPTLGRHLGRWAQVYFTSPPEKREEAVGELLRELQGQPAPATPEPTDTIRIVEDVPLDNTIVQCSHCGHESTNPQRFCGMCGTAFGPEDAGPGSLLVSHPVDVPVPSFLRQRVPDRSVQETNAPRAHTDSVHGDAFAEVPWLRERSAANGAPSSWSRVAPRLAPAIVALLAIGILFYAQSRPQADQSRLPSQAPTAQKNSDNAVRQVTSLPVPERAPAENAGISPPDARNSERIASAARAASTTQAEPVQPPPAPAIEKSKPAAPATTLSQPPADAASQGDSPELTTTNGSVEVSQAEELLSGRAHPRNSAAAAQLLWRAVGKENPSAILMLSDLYLVGDGVPKSCDQARLLLTAAARKGVPQAAEKLRDLLRSGCPR